jgi:glycosyltransferase involved in cell wall biosynthesis
MALKSLLFFGAVRRNKGLHTLLDAMAELREFSLTIAGGLYAEPTYWETVVAPRIEVLRSQGRKIDVVGAYVPEESLHELWDAHSAVVLPYTEGFQAQSGVMYLAVGLQTPIIASQAGGLEEGLTEHCVGELMTSNDSAGLVKAVRRLYERPVVDLEGSLKLAKQELSWDRNAESAIRAYLMLDNRS